jgi:deazaflavin-dependent oxidoreductase (nitroreductase family)
MSNDRDAFNAKVIEEFRANNGNVPSLPTGPILLLTHKGAKTGQERLSPLVYATDGGRIVIAASKAGAPNHPHWYLNITANPHVTIEVGTEKYGAQAVTVTGPERDRLYRVIADAMPIFDEYAAKTDRVIPVVMFERL